MQPSGEESTGALTRASQEWAPGRHGGPGSRVRFRFRVRLGLGLGLGLRLDNIIV